MACWEEPGCKREMLFDCPHDATGICPRSCMYTVNCENPQHERASAMETFSATDVDFSAARKENCHSCRYFLEHAPRVHQDE
ncbi:MAG: hypothetical protein LUD25_02135 [Coriobacteriaceae bacterium]|nr:hypothetical protein [Coriobacteriaceae bacterium]